MDYTLSPNYVTHGGTGNRMHEADQPLPTVVGERDMNSVLWSLMEVVKAAGLTGIQFDPAVPASYQRLLQALNALYLRGVDFTGSNQAFVTGASPYASQRLPGGFILKYHEALYYSVDGDNGTVNTLPTAFPNTLLGAVACDSFTGCVIWATQPNNAGSYRVWARNPLAGGAPYANGARARVLLIGN